MISRGGSFGSIQTWAKNLSPAPTFNGDLAFSSTTCCRSLAASLIDLSPLWTGAGLPTKFQGTPVDWAPAGNWSSIQTYSPAVGSSGSLASALSSYLILEAAALMSDRKAASRD